MPNKTKYKNTIGVIILLLIVIWFYNLLPNPIFKNPYSTVVNDKNGKLLSARIASDGQWRFPVSDTLPHHFKDCITTFEDEYFYWHPGINPYSIFRAMRQNIEAGRVVSGGSTISMQCMRLARKSETRSLWQKVVEMLWTIRLETACSKDEILQLYAAHAPFGGNVVGLEAAAWRYYGRSPFLLSWGEMATLAVLPNAPSLIYPGKNQEKLLVKRNRLLDKLYEKGKIDRETVELAKAEPLPQKPHAMDNLVPHLTDFLIQKEHEGEYITTTIDAKIQSKTQRIVNEFYGQYQQNEINNMAVLVIDIKKAQVLSYVGNTSCTKLNSGREVDIIQAPRSTGSLLKPFLYSMMLQDGIITPQALVEDVPTQISGYSPQNFEHTYDGMVHADEALARSLNIPAVKMLQEYGIEKFYTQLSKLDQRYIDRGANHYGLAAILGGAESCLWDLSNAYLNMAQVLNDQENQQKISVIKGEEGQNQKQVFDVGALWWTVEALSSLERPLQESGWKDFQSTRKIAWKTGTSFGHRDAWAIGFTPDYLVAVWVGNATGEGRPGLTGLSKAAPVMFRVFQYLPQTTWFTQPDWDLSPLKTCSESGCLASEICPNITELMLPRNSRNTKVCSYHKTIQMDASGKHRVNSSCYSVYDMKTAVYFVLPPVPEWYYKKTDPFYRQLPPYLPDCQSANEKNMAIIYPRNYTKILIPRLLDGKKGKVVFEVVHQQNDIIYWHLDDEYIGSTENQHRMELDTNLGKHRMTLVDSKGQELSWRFEVVE